MLDDHTGHVFVTDVGSTTTKGILLARRDGGYRIAAGVNVPTTVEKPSEDVCIGVRAAAEAVGRQAGVQILDESGVPMVPYLTTSSAGGGLQMLVVGLTSTDTGRIAQMAAQGAGGVILRVFTIDDRTPTIHTMRIIRALHPDLILMAGGIDGGDIANVVRLAEILRLAQPTAKFDPEGRIPLVFCGNVDAREYVAPVLAGSFDLHMVDNVRPTLTDTNLRPAKEAILRLFMDTVMERAPGYRTLKGWAAADIIPTPTAVERILELYARRHGQNVVMADMGGATTDVFSNIYGEYRRTVAANIGVSYSLCATIAAAGIDAVMRHLPAGIEEAHIREYAANKMLNPTSIPTEEAELLMEHAAAIAGISVAWRQHQDMNFTVAKVGLLDRLRNRVDFDPFQETFHGVDASSLFHVSDIDVMIGAGGVFSNASTHEAIRMLVDGFLPTGLTKLAVDTSFRSPHLGVLSTVNPAAALELFEESLRDLAYVVAPTGEVHEAVMVSLRDRRSGARRELRGGEVFFAPDGGVWEITPAPGIRLYGQTDEVTLETTLPVLFDCRGRGTAFNGEPLLSFGEPWPMTRPRAVTIPPRRTRSTVVEGPFDIRRELPYEGTIFVSLGDRVEPATPVGENVLTPPRVFLVDVRRLLGYQRRFSPEAIRDGILVKEGDEVAMGQRIFRGREAFLGVEFYCNSPVRGHVSAVEEHGTIVLREIQDYARKPVRVDIAGFLGIPKGHIRSRLEFQVGDFVQAGQELVRGSGNRLPIKAPRSGILKEIDTDRGEVVLHYDLQPLVTVGSVAGTVTDVVPGRSATLSGQGIIIHGAIGFGGEGFGPCRVVAGSFGPDEHAGAVVISPEPIDHAFLEGCRAAGVRGVVAPSVPASDWVRFAGREIATGVTGDEDLPFPVVLTEGFGAVPMGNGCRATLAGADGRVASLYTRTQIRAGVIRPMVVLASLREGRSEETTECGMRSAECGRYC
ncbi:glutamate mutase L [Candidatus Fermentibacteria bacterium]|nr:glutamate mutase L [Candidatus Fermentibacteria bacterium]